MRSIFSYNNFLAELQSSLASSTGEQRKAWAITIIDENVSITELSSLLSCGRKTASHFLWLVSDVGVQNPQKLFTELSALLQFMEQHHTEYLSSFASWWHYCGVPVENETKAIDYLFKWFLSAETTITIKSRALWVLAELSRKYPDLKQELKLCIDDQMDKYSVDFQKRARKILTELE